VLPGALVWAAHELLPDENLSGQCTGIGFGCSLSPADGVLFLGMMAAPFLVAAGLVAVAIIDYRTRRAERWLRER
jgi:hypothetical protein